MAGNLTPDDLLIQSAMLGQVDKVKALLKAGVDVNVHNGHAIQYATESGRGEHFETMRVLLEAGANPNQTTAIGYPILEIAAYEKTGTALKILLKAGADANVSYLGHQSILDGVLPKVRKLTAARRLNINYYDASIKVLCEATNYDEVERLKQLYPEFANVLKCQDSKADIAKNMGAVETALDRAAAKMHPELQDGVELPDVMKNVKDYAYRNVGPGGKRRKTKKRKSGKKKTKKRK